MPLYDRTGAGDMMPNAALNQRDGIAQTMMNIGSPLPRVGMPQGGMLPGGAGVRGMQPSTPTPPPLTTGTAGPMPQLPPVNPAAQFAAPPTGPSPLFAQPPAVPGQAPPQFAKPPVF